LTTEDERFYGEAAGNKENEDKDEDEYEKKDETEGQEEDDNGVPPAKRHKGSSM
jgi:hypothetical protein